jgi:hypothetical protein
MKTSEECCLYDFEIKNLEMGFYMVAVTNDPGLNMELLFGLLEKLNHIRTERDEHRMTHDRLRSDTRALYRKLQY